MSSPLTYTLTNRRTLPVSSQMRSLIPGNFVSRSSTRARTFGPWAFTSDLDVVAVDVYVDEPAHLAGLVANALFDPGKFRFQVVYQGAHVRPLGVYLRSGCRRR